MRTITFRYLLFRVHPSGNDYRLSFEIRMLLFNSLCAAVCFLTATGIVVWLAFKLAYAPSAETGFLLACIAMIEPIAFMCLSLMFFLGLRLYRLQPLKGLPPEAYRIRPRRSADVIPFLKSKKAAR